MGAEKIRFDFKPFTLAVLGIFILEYSAGAVRLDPMIVTGIVRILESTLIVGISFAFGSRALIAGVFSADIRKGIIRGAAWSAIFGALAAVFATGILLAGIDPFDLLRIRLPHGAGRLPVFFIVAGIIGPVAEELFFRGVVYGFLRRWGIAAALIGSTALFGIAHGLGALGLPQLVGGFVFAASYEVEKNLIVPIIIHISGNLALFSIGLV